MNTTFFFHYDYNTVTEAGGEREMEQDILEPVLDPHSAPDYQTIEY